MVVFGEIYQCVVMDNGCPSFMSEKERRNYVWELVGIYVSNAQ